MSDRLTDTTMDDPKRTGDAAPWLPDGESGFTLRIAAAGGAEMKHRLYDDTRDLLAAIGIEESRRGPIRALSKPYSNHAVPGQQFLPMGWMVAIGDFVARLFGSKKFESWATDRVIDLLGGGADDIEADLKVVDMVSKLVDTLDKRAGTAAIDAGVFLFAKIPDGDDSFRIVAKRLNKRDRKVIDDNPSLLLDPVALLQHIDGSEVDPAVVRDMCERVRDRSGPGRPPAGASDDPHTILSGTPKRSRGRERPVADRLGPSDKPAAPKGPPPPAP